MGRRSSPSPSGRARRRFRSPGPAAAPSRRARCRSVRSGSRGTPGSRRRRGRRPSGRCRQSAPTSSSGRRRRSRSPRHPTRSARSPAPPPPAVPSRRRWHGRRRGRDPAGDHDARAEREQPVVHDAIFIGPSPIGATSPGLQSYAAIAMLSTVCRVVSGDLTGAGPTAPDRTVTMQDIARAAGVSQSTVSRILNDAVTTVPIAAVTRQRVLDVANRLGYRPNPLARGLRGAKTMLLGIIVREISDPFFAPAVEAVSTRARERNYNVVLGSAHGLADEAIELHAVLETRHCDAIIVFGDMRDQPRLLDDLAAATVPVVALWQGTALAGRRHRQRRQPGGHRLGRRPPRRPRPSPLRLHRRRVARRPPRAADGVRRAPHASWGCHRTMPTSCPRSTTRLPAPMPSASWRRRQLRRRPSSRRPICSPSAPSTPPTAAASPFPVAGLDRRLRRHPARDVHGAAAHHRAQPDHRDGGARRRSRHRP